MTTTTGNHLFLTTVLKCTSGTWIGETASWGQRFAVNGGGNAPFEDRPELDAGSITLNTFDCHTDVKSRSVTLNSIPGTLSQLWVGDDAPTSEMVTENDIDFFLTKAHDFWTVARTYISNKWQLDHIKLYQVNVEGKSPLGPNMWVATSAQMGSASTTEYSPEFAICVSLYTAHRHKTGRGRLYIGPFGGSALFDSAGLISSAVRTAVLNGQKAVQDSVRTRGTPGSSATYAGIVWSRLDKTRGAVVNRVRLGDEIDRQERRTKSRPESFSEAVVT